MSMETLRQGAQNARVSGGGKGGTRNAFYVRWKPPAFKDFHAGFLAAPPNEEAYLQISEPVVVIAGEYPDPYQRHPDGTPVLPVPIEDALHIRIHGYAVTVKPKNGGQQFQSFKEMVCSAGPDTHAPQPCVGCNDFDRGNTNAKPRDQWVFNIAHLAWYHESPLIKDGQMVMKKDNSGPVMIKNQCLTHKPENMVLTRAAQARARGMREPRACEGCQQGHGFVFGDHRIIQIGYKQMKNLVDYHTHLGKTCSTCGTKIVLKRFECGSCHSMMVDVGPSGMTNDQIDNYAKSIDQCRSCGVQGKPEPYLECGHDERYIKIPGAGCPSDLEPVKGSINNSVIWLQRKGEKMDTVIDITKAEPITTFKTPDGRPLAEHLANIVRQPFNLLEMFKPDSLDEQAEMIGKPNPYASQQPQYQQYGAPQPQGAPGYGPPMGGGYAPPGQYPQPQQGYAPQGAGYPQQPTGYPNMPMPGGRPNYGK